MDRMIAMIVFLLGIMVGSTPGQAVAVTRANAAASAPTGNVESAEVEQAAVTLDGEVLFRVRGLTSYPADERARAIRQRIVAFAADRSLPVESLKVVDMNDRTRVMANDQIVVGFVDPDAAAEGVSRNLIAERAMIRIKAAVARYRNDRIPRVLLINTAYALGATVVLVL